jgi:hypothetical protein
MEIPPVEELEKEMNGKRIVFYSLRHTFHTLCGFYTKNDNGLISNADLIDYFTGHNSGSKMRANYTHINKVDNKTFYDNYGKFIIGMLNKFIFRSEGGNEDIENYTNKFLEERKKDLLNEDGKVDYETGMNVIKEMADTLRPKKTTDKNENDFFTSV